MKQYSFTSDRLRFRSITIEDSEDIVRWRSNHEIIRYFKNNKSITLEEHLEWYANYILQTNRYDFVLEDRFNHKKIGFVALINIDIENLSCEINYTIGEVSYRGKGFAKEAILRLIRFSKDTFNLKNFFAEIHHENISSIELVQSLGFVKKRDGEFCIYKYI